MTEPTDLEYHTMVDTSEKAISAVVSGFMRDGETDPRAIYQALQASVARVLHAFILSGGDREELEQIGRDMRTLYLRALDDHKKSYLQ